MGGPRSEPAGDLGRREQPRAGEAGRGDTGGGGPAPLLQVQGKAPDRLRGCLGPSWGRAPPHPGPGAHVEATLQHSRGACVPLPTLLRSPDQAPAPALCPAWGHPCPRRCGQRPTPRPSPPSSHPSLTQIPSEPQGRGERKCWVSCAVSTAQSPAGRPGTRGVAGVAPQLLVSGREARTALEHLPTSPSVCRDGVRQGHVPGLGQRGAGGSARGQGAHRSRGQGQSKAGRQEHDPRRPPPRAGRPPHSPPRPRSACRWCRRCRRPGAAAPAPPRHAHRPGLRGDGRAGGAGPAGRALAQGRAVPAPPGSVGARGTY